MAPRPDRSPGDQRDRAASARSSARRVLRSANRFQLVGAGLLVLLVALCFIGVRAVLVQSDQEAIESRRQIAAYTPPPLPVPTADVAGSVVALIGDETVARAAASVSPGERWPAVLEQEADVEIAASTSVGAGFVERGRSGRFSELAEDVPLGADVVMFFGGVADASEDPVDVAKALETAVDVARERAPAARIVIVGPVMQGGADEIEFSRLRSTLQSGAAASRATSVDPYAAEWLQLPGRRSASTDDLTVADERSIATSARALLGTLLSGS